MKGQKTFPFFLLVFMAFLFLWIRLFYLQIIKAKENQVLAEGNRIRLIKLPALRGVIFDRFGEVLVRNTEAGRQYLYPELTAHVLGYLAEAAQAELREPLSLGDLVGKTGLEKQYDQTLRGREGGVIVETNVQGEVAREIKKHEPQDGQNLTLALDLELQRRASEFMGQRKGALIASDPRTGEVLSLVSSPSFDPNLFTVNNQAQAELETLLNNPDQPMFNRVIAGLYPPGSIFKIVTAIGALEEKKIDQNTKIEDTGEIKIEKYGQEYTYGNWYFRQHGQTEGMVDIVKAIKRSNDIFFYKVGEWLGIKKLDNWAKYFGLGQATAIDLPGEAWGLVPSPKWKKEVKKEDWYLGDTYITSIGQGDLQLTPLQVNQLVSVIASAGQLCSPHLLKDAKADCQELKISPQNLKLVQEGMKQACESGGTAAPFFDFSPLVACKTGTAEYGDSDEKTHAWFSVYAPFDDPEIVVTVLLEGAGEGSAEAAPVAKKLLHYWFKER